MFKIGIRIKKRVIWENKMNDDFNMSMRKFLKQVGVTSQKAIEDALRDANNGEYIVEAKICLLYTSPSPRDTRRSRMPSSA